MLPFLRYFREELMIVMGTASSDAVLPQVMRKLEHMGIRSSTVGLVIPTGYSFNLDGFSIYLTLAVVFIAHVTGTPLAMTDLVTILLVSLVTSKGAHGIPGSALVISPPPSPRCRRSRWPAWCWCFRWTGSWASVAR